MRTISCKLEDLKTMTLHIGYEGENDYTSVRIDAGSVFAQYPEAVPSMKVQPPKGNMYPVIVTRDGDIVIWNVSDSDTASNGNGEIQLTFTENTVVVKSCTGKTLVHRSLKATGPAPDPLIDFIDRAEEVVGEAQDAAEAAEAAAQHAPMIGLDGYWYKWDAETEEYVKTDTKARGEDGANGVGITSVEKISTVGLVDTYRINFTNGTNTTYTVTNGQDGSVPIDDTTPAANKVFSSAKVAEMDTQLLNAIQGLDDDKKLLSTDIKTALVNIFSHVVFTDTHGQDYIDDLVDAWTPEGSRYTIYEKLIATGDEYIMTDLSETDLDGCSFEYKAKPNSTTKNSGHIMSSTNTHVAFPRIYGNNLSRIFSAKINGGTEAQSSSGAWQDNTDVVVVAFADSSNSVTANENTVIASVTAGETKSSSNKFAICGYAGSTSSATYRFRGALYYLKIFDSNGDLIHHFVPAVDNETEKAGLYDNVGDAFYSSATSTEFTVE